MTCSKQGSSVTFSFSKKSTQEEAAGGVSALVWCTPSDKTKRAIEYYSKYAVVASITAVMAALEVSWLLVFVSWRTPITRQRSIDGASFATMQKTTNLFRESREKAGNEERQSETQLVFTVFSSLTNRQRCLFPTRKFPWRLAGSQKSVICPPHSSL